MRDWVTRESEKTGETINEVLQRVIREAGPKWESIGPHCGMTASAAMAMFNRHNVKKPPARHFVFDGVLGSLQTHCERIGVKYQTLYKYFQRNGLTPLEALQMYKNGKVVRNYGQSRAKL